MNIFALLLLMNLSFLCGADEFVERTLTGTSKVQNPVEARKEIQDAVSSQLAEDLAKDFLGTERFLKNRSQILTKISKSTARFIPFMKPGNLEKGADGSFSMPVTLKASLSSLRQVLQEGGFLNENTAAPLLLPIVTFEDRVNSASDRWWGSQASQTKTLLRTLNRIFENSLRSSFLKAGFHVVRPLSEDLAGSLPKALQIDSLAPADKQIMGDWFGAPLLVDGSISLQKPTESGANSKIEVRLVVFQSLNARPIADVSRSYVTEAGPFDGSVERKWREVVESISSDLAGQVLEAWQKGSVGSSQLKLVLEPRPSLPEIEGLKEKLKSSSAGIRSVRERLISSQSLTFEVDSPVSAVELGARLKGFEFAGRTFDTSVGGDGEVRAKWSRGGAQ